MLYIFHDLVFTDARAQIGPFRRAGFLCLSCFCFSRPFIFIVCGCSGCFVEWDIRCSSCRGLVVMCMCFRFLLLCAFMVCLVLEGHISLCCVQRFFAVLCLESTFQFVVFPVGAHNALVRGIFAGLSHSGASMASFASGALFMC